MVRLVLRLLRVFDESSGPECVHRSRSHHCMPAIRGGLMLRSVRCENLDRVEQAGQGHYRWSGWICTGLDLLCQEMDRKLPLPLDFELSAAHLFFWHKLERCNYFLWTVADLLMRCEPLDGRCFRNLMKNPVPDGGNWQMFVNLVKKYGVMPKKCYLHSTLRTTKLNLILKSKVGILYCTEYYIHMFIYPSPKAT